jgi:hypothetical protein
LDAIPEPVKRRSDLFDLPNRAAGAKAQRNKGFLSAKREKTDELKKNA